MAKLEGDETNENSLMQDLQMLQDATRRWRSSKATKQTRTHRCKTFKCYKMLLEDEGDETRPSGCKYPTPPCAFANILPETTVHPGTLRVPPRVLASGPKPCGGNKSPSCQTRSKAFLKSTKQA